MQERTSPKEIVQMTTRQPTAFEGKVRRGTTPKGLPGGLTGFFNVLEKELEHLSGCVWRPEACELGLS